MIYLHHHLRLCNFVFVQKTNQQTHTCSKQVQQSPPNIYLYCWLYYKLYNNIDHIHKVNVIKVKMRSNNMVGSKSTYRSIDRRWDQQPAAHDQRTNENTTNMTKHDDYYDACRIGEWGIAHCACEDERCTNAFFSSRLRFQSLIPLSLFMIIRARFGPRCFDVLK
jgi:hypothetical protein